MDQLIKLLLKLLRIKSISGYEEHLLEFLVDWLDRLGIDYQLQQVDSRRNLLVDPWKPVIMSSHLDTAIYFPPKIQGNRIYGAGAADTKSGVALMLELISHFRPILEDLPLGFCFLVDEEKGGLGSSIFCQEYLPQLGIILEPTGLDPCILCSGSLEFEISIPGESRHPASLQESNPIWDASKLLEELRRDLPTISHSMLGESKLKLLEIRAGNDIFRTPDRCSIRAELIFPPDQNPFQILSWMRSKAPAGAKLEIWDHSPSYRSRDHPLIQDFLEIVRSQIPGSSFGEIRSWTDANNFHEFGSSWIVFGPGSLDYCHTREEYISIEDLQLSYGILAKFCSRLQQIRNQLDI